MSDMQGPSLCPWVWTLNPCRVVTTLGPVSAQEPTWGISSDSGSVLSAFPVSVFLVCSHNKPTRQVLLSSPFTDEETVVQARGAK